MILLIAIILFIIFLIYSIKPRGEGYTLEGLKLSWKNKSNIESVVYKWIIILRDNDTDKILHQYENSDTGNLKDFTDVTMNIVENKEFDNKIIGDNTLELYYNKVSADTIIYTKTVTFTENDFGYTIDTSKLEEIDIPVSVNYADSVWFGYENSSWSDRPLNIAEIEIYSGGVNVATKAIKTEASSLYHSSWYQPKSLIDGNKNNFAHTKSSKNNWFKITLDKKYPIEKVKVYNRTNCCYDRWAGSFVKLLDEYGNEIARSMDSISTNRTTAKNYKENGVRVKTFKFRFYKYDPNLKLDTTGDLFWTYYTGSYFSKPSDFVGKYIKSWGSTKKISDKKTGTSNKVTGGDTYSIMWRGYFVPKATGNHTFWTQSDDMSYLYINDIEIVNNGGQHGMVTKSGSIKLDKGIPVKLDIYFSENYGGDDIKVWFQGPDMTSASHDFTGYLQKLSDIW